MARRFFSGNSLEQALLAAAREFELEPESVAYVQRDKKHGFLKVRRRVVIEVDPAAPQRRPEELQAPPPQSQRATPPPRPQARPQPRRAAAGDEEMREPAVEVDAAVGPEAGAVAQALCEVLRFARLDLSATVAQDAEGVYQVALSGADEERVVRDGGEVLEAVETLLPRLVRGLQGTGVPCKVDCAGYLAAHEAEVRERAAAAADAARSSGEPQRLEPMSPADRRLVHLALAEDPSVETESDGEGYFKQVTVFPA